MSKKEKEFKKDIREKLETIEKETEDMNKDIKFSSDKKELKDKLRDFKEKLEETQKELEEQKDSNIRLRAEFENYKRRTQKEKELIYNESVADTIKTILPIIYNFERALGLETNDSKSFKDGMDMIYRQLKDAIKNNGVEEIKSVGEKFDPTLHNAVMHVEDDEVSDNTVIEEFQKGYKIGNKVIRHSMVKVAN